MDFSEGENNAGVLPILEDLKGTVPQYNYRC